MSSTTTKTTSSTSTMTTTTYRYYGNENEKIPDNVTHVIIDSTVTEILNYAFADHDNIQTVDFSPAEDGSTLLKTIGDGAFCNCTNLTSVTIPSSVTYIGEMAFLICTSLTQITLLNNNDEDGKNCNLKVIGKEAFNSTSIQEITIPSTVTKLGQGCLASCEELISVTFVPKHENGHLLTEISKHCFENCPKLTKITIPASVEILGESCFAFCSALEKVLFENNTSRVSQLETIEKHSQNM